MPSYFQTNVLSKFSFADCFGFLLIFFLNLGFYCNAVEYRHKYHNRQHISIRKKSLLYCVYDGATRRDSVSNVGIESVGSAGQAGFTYQALV